MMIQGSLVSVSYSHSNNQEAAAQAAAKQYWRVLAEGWWKEVWSRLTRRPRHLLCLSKSVSAQIARGTWYREIQEVPIAQIRGSEGRCQDFDREFKPRQEHTRERWIRVATAWQMGKPLPPVELIQIGDIYFVRDGHHRISVAKSRGQTYIEADVIRSHMAQKR
ncbi:MAG: hypothetical protein M3220_19560 [Chloroflexota bacterium]|nr:hypothetical protein [Chloroflexota bacterium]